MSLALHSRTLVVHALVALALQSGVVGAHEPDADEIALGSLANADLAFARDASERGVRAASLSRFASDGVLLDPVPVRLREAWDTSRDVAGTHARVRWAPAQTGVAHSRDLGFTTGAATWATKTGSSGATRGVYFSAWQRRGRGDWEVILHTDMQTPAAVDFAKLGEAPRAGLQHSSSTTREREDLLAMEANAFGCGASALTPTCYAQRLSDDVRLYREGHGPLASRGVVAPELARRLREVTWSPQHAWISAAADMAVTYGRYRETDRGGRRQQGAYAHLWLRDRAGVWRLAYDLALTGQAITE